MNETYTANDLINYYRNMGKWELWNEWGGYIHSEMDASDISYFEIRAYEDGEYVVVDGYVDYYNHNDDGQEQRYNFEAQIDATSGEMVSGKV